MAIRKTNSFVMWATWVLFVAVVYLILTEGLWYWTKLPGLGNIGFTLVFVLFAILHCAASAGWRTTAIFFVIAAVVSYLLEEVGVRTGWIYGPYHYSDLLGAKLGHVPVIIPLAWFMMIYPSWMVGRSLTGGLQLRPAIALVCEALVAAVVMTGWDAVMDPGMAAAGNWIWERGGTYFGVPLQNYFGWLLTTFTIYLAAGWLWLRQDRKAGTGATFNSLPIIVYGFYGLAYMTPRPIAALQLVALFAMVMPALLALTRVWGDPTRQTAQM